MVNALDTIALTYAIVACLFLDGLAVVLIVLRKQRAIFPHQPWFLATMALSATCHIVAEAVTNNHAGFLVGLERSACAFFGYWLAYFFGAGFFFCALYMRLLIYATAISRTVSQLGAQRTRRLRWIICSLILLPVATVSSFATAESAGATDTCASSWVLKILVGIWLSALIFMLVLSACLLRRGIVRDVASELQKQAFVAGIGFVVLGALVFTMIISEDGLGDAINRFISTVAVTTFYLYTLGVLACAPLFRSYLSKGYAALVEDRFSSLTQPADSMLVVLACAGFSAPCKKPHLTYYQQYPMQEGASEAASALFADFLLYCAQDDQNWMNRNSGGGGTEDPAVLCVAFAKFDHWTQRRREDQHGEDDYCLDHGDELNSFPPLVSSALEHSTMELVARYFAKPGTPGFIDLGLQNATRDAVTASIALADDNGGVPASLFREAMWEIVSLLDRYYGHAYLTADILRRDIFVSVTEPMVRQLLNDVQRCEAQRRLHEANLAHASPDSELGDVAVEVELS
jgi:hypothetical protein